MKKVLLLLVILAAVLGITACNPFHTHKGNGKYTVVKEPTCTTEGQSQMLCTECGEVAVSVPIPAMGHKEVIIPAVEQTCTETGLTEGKYCSVCDTLLVKPSVVNKHHFVDSFCSDCGEMRGSNGLKFRSNNDGTCIVVGIGTCTDTDIGIPSSSPNGENVISIGLNAFAGCDSLTNVLIPDSVTSINGGAFSYCLSLTSVIIPDSVKNIEYWAFCYCRLLTTINFEGTVEQWHAINKVDQWNYNTVDYTIYCTDGEIAKNGTVTYYEAEKPYVREGDYIYFGEYPQTIKADDITITDTQDSRGYYLGSDGSYYAKVTAESWSFGKVSFSTGATVSKGTVYYFKVEPIRWRILSEENGEAFILCDSIIANHRFDDDSNNYADSEIRAWLNSTFYETVFSDLERSLILTTEVDNGLASTGDSSNPNACENTYDKLFLLSYEEAINNAYGFLSDNTKSDTAKSMLTSDYSRATGEISTMSDYYGNGWWRLRSPGNDDLNYAKYVSPDGSANGVSGVSYSGHGIVPALRMTL